MKHMKQSKNHTKRNRSNNKANTTILSLFHLVRRGGAKEKMTSTAQKTTSKWEMKHPWK
jgi:hypothetical protein